ncbi:hypothetical protein ACOXXX_07360 [Thalassococcus sp. BH17M4-6]|uniref:hypothetical protein n=1 Tax=Thalassococcus sp. BH17M4-6 TaxID=3413148 RepID=UPI003BE44988
MDIILHLGAHRCASTSFQTYMRQSGAALAGQGIGFWGPHRTRRGLFHDLADQPSNSRRGRRAAGRVALSCAATARRGAAVLLVSDENMIGTPRGNLRAGCLYPQIGERMARFHNAFGQGPRRAMLQIRSLDSYWASLLAYLLPRGAPCPGTATLAMLATAPRSWRQVITELACAMPGTDLVVTPFERFAARPDRLLHSATGLLYAPTPPADGPWCNRAPDVSALAEVMAARGEDPARLGTRSGRWMPFSPREALQLRNAYADDLNWLRAGADGLARYIEETDPDKTRITWPPGLLTRGRNADDIENPRVARSG